MLLCCSSRFVVSYEYLVSTASEMAPPNMAATVKNDVADRSANPEIP